LNRTLTLAAALAATAIATPLVAQQAPAAASPATATATQPQLSTAEEIKLLRARLDQLEAQQKAAEQKQERQKTIEEVVNDAQRHSMLIDNGDVTAGYRDGRFFIGSADGNFMLRPWSHIQIRNASLWRQDGKSGGRDQTDNGFEIRRMKLGFDGNLFTPDFTYFFNWQTIRANSNVNVTGNANSGANGQTIATFSNGLGGELQLEEAWVKYHFHGTPWYVKAGQLKDPLLHDQIVSSRYQQSAERSLIADIFANGDAFTEGATLIYDPDSWYRFEGGINQSLRGANTNFLDYPTNSFNYGLAARGEFKLMGRWKDYAQVGAVGTAEPLLVIGVGADYSERGHSGQTVGVVDAMYGQPLGFNLYAAAVDRYTTHNFGVYTQSATGASIGTPDPNVADKPTNEYGALIQVGYKIDPHWEPFGRYEYFHLEGTPAGSNNYTHAIMGGVNYYFVGHRAKLTAEINFLPNGIPIDDSANDIFKNNNHAELLGEIQFQMLL
jgi:hypothetical protein